MENVALTEEEEEGEEEEGTERAVSVQVLSDTPEESLETRLDNCVYLLFEKRAEGVDATEEMEFIARNFSHMSPDTAILLSARQLEEIFQKEEFRHEDQNALLDLLSNLSSTNPEYSRLFRFVQIESVGLDAFMRCMDVIYENRVCKDTWKELMRKRLESARGQLFQESPMFPMKGIFTYLRALCGGNPHTNHLINITASSTTYNEPYFVIEYGSNNCWHTDPVPYSWIQFDFKTRKVSLWSYTLKTYNMNKNSSHLKEWAITGSNDGSNWELLDGHDTARLNHSGASHTFQCKYHTRTFFRYIRLTCTGPNHGGNNYLVLSEIEFFGRLITDN